MNKIFFILFSCMFLPGLCLADPQADSLPEPAHMACDARCKQKTGGFAKRWLHSLPEDQQTRARAIIQEAMPEITHLRRALREKVDALADLNYDEVTPPEKLLQLGRELQETRNAMNERLARLESDLRESVGSSPKSLRKLGRNLPDQK